MTITAPNYGQLPLYLIPNEGQVDERALFYAKTSQYTLWLMNDGLIFARSCIRDISRMEFLNANAYPRVLPVDLTGYKVNDFIGKDRSKWRTGIQASKAVLYQDLYTNIDLKIYGVEKQIEYDFVVRPGGEVSDISFAYGDTERTIIDKDGNLKIITEAAEDQKVKKTVKFPEFKQTVKFPEPRQTAEFPELAHAAPSSNFAEFTHVKPLCYQVIDGRRIDIEASFNKVANNTYNFEVGSYNKVYDLIIDPLVLTYSTYLGGSSDDYGNGIAIDSSGAVYITGSTYSTDFPTSDPYQASLSGQRDVFVTKINSGGSSLVYSTYLGGMYGEEGIKKGTGYFSRGNQKVACPLFRPLVVDVRATN